MSSFGFFKSSFFLSFFIFINSGSLPAPWFIVWSSSFFAGLSNRRGADIIGRQLSVLSVVNNLFQILAPDEVGWAEHLREDPLLLPRQAKLMLSVRTLKVYLALCFVAPATVASALAQTNGQFSVSTNAHRTDAASGDVPAPHTTKALVAAYSRSDAFAHP